MITANDVSLVANVVIAAGVILTALQLRMTKRQAITQFEDAINREYRHLVMPLPTKALFGQPLTDDEHEKHKETIVHYIDLCNEQVFLRRTWRVSGRTCVYWREGIEYNMTQPAFARVWAEVKQLPDIYRELRQLEQKQWRSDPVKW